MNEIDRRAGPDVRAPTGGPTGPVLVRHAVHPGLRGLVAGIVGYREYSLERVVRRQPAGSLIPIVLSFGPQLEIMHLSHGAGVGAKDSFAVGPMPGHATTSFETSQHCLQVYVTPLGASRLFSAPASAIANHVVELTDVIPDFDGGFHDRVWSAGRWDQRFAIVDEALLRLAARSPAADPMVAWMWHQIHSGHGSTRIAALVEETGMSHRHVTTRFRHLIGTTPKVAAAVVRFERAAAALQHASIADVAATYGYADQSHLTREFVRFSGETPSQLRAARRPTAHTAIGAGTSR